MTAGDIYGESEYEDLLEDIEDTIGKMIFGVKDEFDLKMNMTINEMIEKKERIILIFE